MPSARLACLMSLAVVSLGAATGLVAGELDGAARSSKESAKTTAYESAVRHMLQSGFQRGRTALATARRHEATARRIRSGDPRLDYAFGLVLLKHLKSREASDRFQRAARLPGAPHLPVRQAIVRYELKKAKRDYQAAIRQLVAFAEEVANPEVAVPDVRTKSDYARWIGRVAGYLEGPAGSQRARTSLIANEPAIRKHLGPRYHEAYENGKNDVVLRLEDLQKSHGAALNTEAKQKDASKKRLVEDRKGIEKKQKRLEVTDAKWKRWLTEETGNIDRNLAKLEKEFVGLEAKGESLTRSILLVSQEIQEIRAQAFRDQSRNDRDVGRRFESQLNFQLKQEEGRRYQAEHSRVRSQMQLVGRRARGVLAARRAAVRRYEKATGTLVKQKGSLLRLEARLLKKTKKVETAPAGKSARAASTSRKIRSLSSYDVFDLEAEKQRVLKSFVKQQN